MSVFDTVVTQSARSSHAISSSETSRHSTPNVALGNDVGIPEDTYDAFFRTLFPGFEPLLEAVSLFSAIDPTTA